MSAIFISHSSRDNEFSEKLRVWLHDLGHRSVFLDFDASSGIAAGHNWEQKLYQELRVCRAVIVVCTENLMNSKWCFAEITQARSLGKHIFPIKVAECEIDSVLSDSQVVDFLKLGDEEAFERLKHGLAVAGIDAEDPYDWDGSRSPYPGLLSFQEADAAIFFGRDKEIGDGLDVLNGMHRYGGSGLVMTLGASGSGKSSLIRAGVVPRLKKDPERWLVIDPFQPGDDPFLEFAKVLSSALHVYAKIRRKANEIQENFIIHEVSEEQTITSKEEQNSASTEEVSQGLDELPEAIKALESMLQNSAITTGNSKHKLLRSSLKDLQKLRNQLADKDASEKTAIGNETRPEFIDDLIDGSSRKNASVLVIIDQFEELLNRPPDHLGSQFLTFLRHILDAKDSKLVVLATMRSDFLGAFQQNPALRGLEYGKILIGPVDKAALSEIIEKPADLAGVRIEPKLLQALIEDAGADDTLPLLAFTLRELYDKYSDDSVLDYHEYNDLLGGIQGAVAKAAESVLEKPPLTIVQEEGLRKAFLFMSRINENGQFTREVARWSDMPMEVHEVLERLVTGRLLVSRGSENGDDTIEVAHETLFRSWKRLKTWLDEDREFLLWRSRLVKAKEEWDYNEQDKKALLKGTILNEASSWFKRYKDQLNAEEQVFVQESLNEANRKRRKRNLQIIGSMSLFVIIGIIMTTLFFRARTEKIKARANYLISEAANSAYEYNQTAGLRLAEKAWETYFDKTPALPLQRVLSETFYGSDGTNTLFYDYRIKEGHTATVYSADFSPDGSRIVTASKDKTAVVWDVATGKQLFNLIGHTDQVRRAVFSPDSTQIITASFDQTAIIWNAVTGALMTTLEGHTGKVYSAVFSPDGTKIVTASEDRTALIWKWDGMIGTPMDTLRGHTDELESAVFSPDGTKIVTASYDKTAIVWDALKGTSIDTLQGHTGKVHSAIFSPDGSQVVTGSGDKTAIVWDATGKPTDTLKGHTFRVQSLAFSPDGSHLVTASRDHTAKVWNTATWKKIAELKGHTGTVWGVIFSSDGKQILTASGDQTAVAWNLSTRNKLNYLKEHTGNVISASFSPDSLRVVTASQDNTAIVWEVATGELINTLEGHTSEVRTAVFSRDGTKIVTASNDKTAIIWNAKDGREIIALEGHSGEVRSAVFSPDGEKIVTTSKDGSAIVWNAKTYDKVSVLNAHSGAVNSAVFSPDGTKIVTASMDSNAIVWDAKTYDKIADLNDHTDEIYSAVFSPDGNQIVTASKDKTAILWGVGNWASTATLRGHTKEVRRAAFSPDGIKVVTASFDQTAMVWEADTGELMATLKGHTDKVWSAVFSPDGDQIVTASNDNSAIVWDVVSGKKITPLRGHRSQVVSAVFSPDGKKAVTTSNDGTAIVHRVSKGIIDWLKEHHFYELTTEDMEEHGIDFVKLE